MSSLSSLGHLIPTRIGRHLLAALVLLGPAACANELPLDTLQVPQGFSIELYAPELPGARSMAIGPEGLLFVGTRREGRVYAVVDRNGDMRADRVHVLADGLFMPNGIAYRDDTLYVAEVNRILQFNDISSRLEDPPEPQVVYDDLPSETHHGWRYVAFGPDGHLYVAVGAPCNICDEPGYAHIRRVDLEQGSMEIIARGVRNSVGFDWHPRTNVLWFTDNGRDWLGDTRPPDELNRARREDLHFGFPYCHGRDLPDPDYGADQDCAEFEPPAWEFTAHAAALGMRFYDADQFPARYRHRLFVAQHGSWNRSEKVGYRVMEVEVRDGRAVAARPFVEGWLRGQRAWGRPVDVEIAWDGSLLISDDSAGAIYRVVYTGPPNPDAAR